jgi:hypothetical protein
MILYGQTSSGKTFTLFGDSDFNEPLSNLKLKNSNFEGIHLSDQNSKNNEIVSNLKSDLNNLNYKDNLYEYINDSESQLETKNKNMKNSMLIRESKENLQGIIPRYLKSLFEEIQKLQSQDDAIFNFEYSFFEIYKEKIYDLINQTYDYIDDGNGRFKQVLKSLNLREKKNKQVVIGRKCLLNYC